MPHSASFDVIGTCFSFTAPITTITTRLGPALAAAHIDAKTLFFSWFYAAQRDFTYLSLCGRYTPIAAVLRHTFRRACRTVDVPAEAVSDEDVAAVMAAFGAMEAREGLAACVEGLRDEGWDVCAVTNGGVETTLGYFRRAGIALEEGDLVSCDDLRVAKPDGRVYEGARARAERMGAREGEGERWFVAAHAWDLVAARGEGFRTAYLGFEEHDAATEIFGEFDLYAGSMGELLEKLKQVG